MKRHQGSHLTLDERCHISVLRESGLSSYAIAEEIGVNQSTISRELRRNRHEGEDYNFKQAQKLSDDRRREASSTPRRLTDEILDEVRQMLESTQSSPVQISGRLKAEGKKISAESIYQWIWRDKHQGGKLYEHLRHRHKKYNKRGAKLAGRGLIPGRVDIDQRPKIVEEKKRFGDLELDTIVGAKRRGAIVSVVDRATKYVWLRLVSRATAEEVSTALREMLSEIAELGLINTLTADNGKEFADHKEVSKVLKGDFYFAKPYHSWERGLNEHTNGLVRQYVPKGSKFDTLTAQEVEDIAATLNQRPRKSLDFKTPTEKMLSLCPQLANDAFRS